MRNIPVHVGGDVADKESEEARRKLRKGDDAPDSIQLERQPERQKHGWRKEPMTNKVISSR